MFDILGSEDIFLRAISTAEKLSVQMMKVADFGQG